MVDSAVFSLASGDEWTMLGIGLETWLVASSPIVAYIFGVLTSPMVKRVPGGIARLAQWTYRATQRRIIAPVNLWRLRQVHGVRIELLDVHTWDELEALPEEDQDLLRQLRPRKYHRLLMSSVDEVLNREPYAWELEAQSKADKAALEHAVYTKSGEKLECWNYAFFVSDLKEDARTKEYKRNPYGGYCHRELPAQETKPSNFCGHHSALQGYLRNPNAELYNIAPVE